MRIEDVAQRASKTERQSERENETPHATGSAYLRRGVQEGGRKNFFLRVIEVAAATMSLLFRLIGLSVVYV